jgi:hypothetical protein
MPPAGRRRTRLGRGYLYLLVAGLARVPELRGATPCLPARFYVKYTVTHVGFTAAAASD